MGGEEGYLPWMGAGVPTSNGGEGVPTLDGVRALTLHGGGVPSLGGYLPWSGEGVPTLDRLCAGSMPLAASRRTFLFENRYFHFT